MPDRYYTVQELSTLVQRHPRTVYRWIKEQFILPSECTIVKDGYLIKSSFVSRVFNEARKKDHMTS